MNDGIDVDCNCVDLLVCFFIFGVFLLVDLVICLDNVLFDIIIDFMVGILFFMLEYCINGGLFLQWENVVLGFVVQVLFSVILSYVVERIVDVVGCVEIFGLVIIIEVFLVIEVIVDEVVNILCVGVVSGSIIISVSGGMGMFSYFWSNGLFNNVIIQENFIVGSYFVIIMDELGGVCQ